MTTDAPGPTRAALFFAWPVFDATEVAFWRRLSDALQCEGLRLVLVSPRTPPADLGVAHIPAIPSVDTFWPMRSDEPAVALHELTLDVAALLAREEAAGSAAVLTAVERYRHRAMEGIADHWLRTLETLDPAVVVIWNGQHVVEIILDAASRWVGVPVLYVERAPIAQAMFADDRGLSAASDVARRVSWTVDDERWRTCATDAIRRMAAGRHTWWEQPESRNSDALTLRRELGIPAKARVLLFASQMDGDTQQFLFSPHFATNEAAFRWFLDQLRGREDVFVLGKQHPQCSKRATFARALAESGVHGQWRSDVSIDDALAVADRVAAVNSTVLYEALARERPVLSMGGWLLGGRGAAYEVTDLAKGRGVVEAWLRADNADARQRAWREGLAYLLSSCLYTYEPELEASGMRGARDLADRIGTMARRPRAPHLISRLAQRQRVALAPKSAWFLPGDSQLLELDGWQRAHTLRYHLLTARDEAERGRRLMIWGAGQAGRAAERLLAGLGVAIDAFVSSVPDATHVAGRPLLPPSAVCGAHRDVFVLIASMAAHDIVPMLVAGGATREKDFVVLDCNLLADAQRDLTGNIVAAAPADVMPAPAPVRPSGLRTTEARTAVC